MFLMLMSYNASVTLLYARIWTLVGQQEGNEDIKISP